MAKTPWDCSKGDIQKHADKLLATRPRPALLLPQARRRGKHWQGPLQIPQVARHFAEANTWVASVRRGIDDRSAQKLESDWKKNARYLVRHPLPSHALSFSQRHP
jgi:hypothetical protein